MPALNANYPTLLDFAKRSDKSGNVQDVVEILSQMSPVAKAGYVEVCNDGTRHLTTMRTSIPSPTWVQYYSRITPVKSTTRQVTDTTGMMEAMVSIDKRLYDRQKDGKKYRLQEAMGVLEGFAQEVEQTFFYGNTGTSPLEFLGLAPRMSSLSAENGRQIIDAGGTGSDNTSLYIATWGPRTGHLIVPENVQTGVEREDKGVQRSETTDGVIYYVEEQFRQHIGFAMVDWRYFSRVANIDVSNLTTASAADLVDLLITAYYRLPSRRATSGFTTTGEPVKITPVIYCNATIKEYLDKQLLRQPNGYLTRMEFMGEEVNSFRGFPILETDGIVNTETRVT
jgi:hypothetical protein